MVAHLSALPQVPILSSVRGGPATSSTLFYVLMHWTATSPANEVVEKTQFSAADLCAALLPFFGEQLICTDKKIWGPCFNGPRPPPPQELRRASVSLTVVLGLLLRELVDPLRLRRAGSTGHFIFSSAFLPRAMHAVCYRGGGLDLSAWPREPGTESIGSVEIPRSR